VKINFSLASIPLKDKYSMKRITLTLLASIICVGTTFGKQEAQKANSTKKELTPTHAATLQPKEEKNGVKRDTSKNQKKLPPPVMNNNK
jgi:hypothetical protein